MLIRVLLLWLALAVPIHSADASEVGSCGFTTNALRKEVGASGSRIDAIQIGLAAVFSGRRAFDQDVRNGSLRDQVLGRRTEFWIGTFCDEFKPALTTDRIATVEAALHHYAAIAKAREDWRDVVRGEALETWLQKLPSAKERWLQLSGPAASVINLLDVFPRLPPTPHDFDVADIAYQQIGAAHPKWREILASTAFSDWIKADKSGMRALRRSGSPPIVIGLLHEYAAGRPPTDACSATRRDDISEDAVYYRLEAADIKSLAAPAQRQPALQALVGQTFDKKSGLIEAVAEALPALAASCPPDVFATIVTGPSDEAAVGAVLDAGSMNRLTLKNLPADQLRAISILEGRVFATRKDLAEAVRFRIDEALLVSSLEPAAGPPLPTASPETEAAAVTPPPPEGALDAAPTPTAPPVARGDPEPEHTGQQSSHQSSQQQQNRGLAAGTDDGYGRYDCPGCRPVTPKQVDSIVKEAVSVYGLSAASAARLAQMADAAPVPTPLPEDWLAALESLQGVAFVNRRLFLRAVETRLNIVVPTNVDAEQMTPIIAAAARKQEPSPYPPVTITSEGCGCLRNFSDTIYGFLPPWIGADDATGAAAAEQAASAPTLPVDFSVLSRVGYFGLTLQADGWPKPDRQWQPSFDLGGFIATAHRHRTQVDLVVRAAGWRTWTDSVVQDRGVDQIVSHVTRTIKPAAMPAIGWQTLFNRVHSTHLDGVSLFFEDYDATAGQREIIDSVVTKLRAKLDAENRPYFVNLVFDVDLLPAAKSNQLESILSVAQRPAVDAAKRVDLVLLFLQQPSSEAKKRLRSLLDNSDAFHGQERKDLLRRIVPVISPDGHVQPQYEQMRSADSFQQFDDDLIYFEDNFGGVGFWPLPKRTSGDYERLRGLLVQRFATGANFLEPSEAGLAMQVCDFACPNRWLFRVAIDAVGGLLLLTALGASLSCRFRTILGKYSPAILALAVVLGCLVLITILCDPFWQKRRDSVGLGLILLLAMFVISRYVVALKRKRLP